jgi:high-affinity Fe2+/Pb2+ permease
MAGALIIVLREAVEAGLIIGIVLAVTIWVARHGRQMSEDMRRLGRDVMSGARSLMALAVVVGSAKAPKLSCFFMESSFRAVNQG